MQDAARLDAQRLDELCERTEGWAAGLVLAGAVPTLGLSLGLVLAGYVRRLRGRWRMWSRHQAGEL
mgnify:CR=1 FL=1